MLCSRAHREDWKVFCLVVDAVFVLVRLRLHRHCRQMEEWERRVGRRYE